MICAGILTIFGVCPYLHNDLHFQKLQLCIPALFPSTFLLLQVPSVYHILRTLLVKLYDIMKEEKIGKIHMVGVSLGAVLAQDFANHYPDMVKSLACFGGYDINNFDMKMQRENSASQMLMMLKALFSIKWFAKSNKKISAFTLQAQNDFYDMNIQFPKKSFMYLSSLNSMVNIYQTFFPPS